MKKENSNRKVGLIVGFVLFVVLGSWIGLVGYYSISNVSEEELRQINPAMGILALILLIIPIMIIIAITRKEKEENLIKR